MIRAVHELMFGLTTSILLLVTRLASGSIAVAADALSAAANRPPSFVFILVDDLGWIREDVMKLAFPAPAQGTQVVYAELGSAAGYIGAAGCARLAASPRPA